jgi:radical SAM superfamily enzyme YgiQ (UPF0313 family)
MLTQNRQFQWYHVGSYIFPVVSAYAATLLKNDGFEVVWNDGIAQQWSWDRFEAFFRRESPDLLVLESKTPVVKLHWDIVNALKMIHPECRIALTGDHVTAFPQETLEQCAADFVITGGNYDISILRLARRLRDGEGTLPEGIWYREKDSLRDTGPFDLDFELNELPWIDRELTMAHLYGEKWKRRTPFFYTMAGRDCHWHKCTFCSWTTLYPEYHVRSPENLLDEIEYLVKDWGVREIFDDTGTFPVGEWLSEFCEGMIRRELHRKILFSCNMRFDFLNDEIAKLMKKAGFRKLKSGLESANQRTLDRINKGTTIEHIVNGCKSAARMGLDIHLTAMVGYPWESRVEAENTIKLAKRLMAEGDAEMLQATVVVPYPGTPLYRMAIENDWFRFDPKCYERYDMTEPVLKTPGMTAEEVVQMCQGVYRSFLTPKFVLRQLLQIRSLEDLDYFARGVKAVTGHLMDFMKIRK